MTAGEEYKKTEFLTVKEIAETLKISKKTVYDWAAQGKITPFVVAGHIIRFSADDVFKLVQKKKH